MYIYAFIDLFIHLLTTYMYIHYTATRPACSHPGLFSPAPGAESCALGAAWGWAGLPGCLHQGSAILAL